MSQDGKSHQLPSSMVASIFGEINVTHNSDHVLVDFTILTTPDAEASGGYQTGVAIDASKSMKDLFGQTHKGSPPKEVVAEWKSKGWITSRTVDGRSIAQLSAQARAEAIKRGFFKKCENVIQPIAREFTAYLAEGLDEDGGTTVLYWACGKQGEEVEVLGDFTAEECKTLEITGPSRGFGDGSCLLPAITYFSDRFCDAMNGIYVFITDGRISDFEAVCDKTVEYANEIHRGERNAIKFVLIGVGSDLDVEQFEALDDLEAPVDLWDYKLANELRDLSEIFSELVDENEILLPPSEIFDDAGRLALALPHGVPGRCKVSLPPNCRFFELRSQGERIRQPIVIEG